MRFFIEIVMIYHIFVFIFAPVSYDTQLKTGRSDCLTSQQAKPAAKVRHRIETCKSSKISRERLLDIKPQKTTE